ncbi:hypothetical protein OE88DRAFT_1664862 [Heliocybe sulcata]|uniref:Extracellular membrane protein CFEM domain-containing protein n=1 Tax=Heliocybe sulcata TaxID=5364 RepID=A0A5C3MS82_9AGAM|nr:hypothetical protein OE88DRAFT_1664862 [Heliocybe sulcata]
MRFSIFVPVALACALAGRVAALTITIGGTVGNVSATDFLQVPASMSACAATCKTATDAIAACTDDHCLCVAPTVTDILACEQCEFTQLIAQNIPMPDPRVGSSTALTAYGAACLASANVTVPATSLTLALPSNWDGPFGQALNAGGTAVTVIIGLGLGVGSIFLLSNM